MTTTKTKRTPERLQDVPLYLAPSCDGDVLAAVPVLSFGGTTHETIALVTADGVAGDADRVVERRDLYRHNLTLVATETHAYLMPTPERAHKTDAERHLTDLMDDVDGLMAGIARTIDREALSPAALLMWDAADSHIGGKGAERCLSYVMCLDALLTSPETVQRALQALREELVTTVPELALMGSPAPQVATVPQDHRAYVVAAAADPDVRQQLRFELMLELITRLGRVTGEMSKDR